MALVSSDSNLERLFESAEFQARSISGFGGGNATSDTQPRPVVINTNGRLYQLHEDGRETVPTSFGRTYDNSGFTRPFLPLSQYYSQVLNDTGQFGIRNDGINSDNQPYVIRSIGQRWGTDDVDLPSSVPPNGLLTRTKLDSAVALQFRGGGPTNRDSSEFKNRYKADVIRLSNFGDRGGLYSNNQTLLQGRNRFTHTSPVRYGLLSDVDQNNPSVQSVTNQFLNNLLPDGTTLLDLSPQVYNPDSIYSVPGVSGMMFNRMGRAGEDVLNISNQVDKAKNIAGQISLRALELAAPKAAEIISKGIGKLGNKIKEGAAGFAGSIATKTMTTDIGFGGKSIPVKTTIKTLADSAKETYGHFQEGGKYESVTKFVKGANEQRKRAGLLFANEQGRPSKASLTDLDPSAFKDLNVDKVNLIPYGDGTNSEGISYEKLDFLPFSFYDPRGKDPFNEDSVGARIVFRAILSGITDTFSPEYSSERYVGRPDNVYVYQGTNREISFTFDIYPKSDTELVTLWTKMNYLAGLTYPHWSDASPHGGMGMIAPFTKLTIGDMYKDTPGYISSLTYTVQDNTTWETTFAKLPKYIQASCTFVYIGDQLPAAEQQLYNVNFVAPKKYEIDMADAFVEDAAKAVVNFGTKALNSLFDKKEKPLPEFKDLQNATPDIA